MLEVLARDPWLTCVRLVGVTVGVLGTIRTAPDAAREIVGVLVHDVQEAWDWLRKLLRLRKPVHVHVVLADDAGTFDAVASIAIAPTREPWPSSTVDQVAFLRRAVDAVSAEVSKFKDKHEADLSALRSEVASANAEQMASFTQLASAQETHARRALRLNARGLPLVGVSVVLAGSPDALVRYPPVALALIAGACVALWASWRASGGQPGPTP